jgi:hypothetical protein
MERNDLVRFILHYLLKNPDAGDTIEGIMHWWVRSEMLQLSSEGILEAVELLCSEGILVQRKLRGDEKVYFFNKSRIQEARLLLSKI